MIVMKFGGTSVKDVAAVRRLIGIVGGERRPKVVVVSALSKVTDALIQIGRLAEQGDAPAAAEAVRALHRRHAEMAALVETPQRKADLVAALDELFHELETIVHALAVIEEVSPRSADTIVAFGELASSRIVAAAFEDAGLRSRWLDARQVLITDAQHGAAQPDRKATDERLLSLVRPLALEGQVPVLGGFVGATAAGLTTTLGRGGSDYSAALFGAGLAADEIQIWTDVDGMLTGRPAGGRGPEGRPAAQLRRGLGARLLRRQGPAPEHDPARGGARHPGADPELAAAGGPGHADHARDPRATATGPRRSRASGASPASTSPPRGC